MKYEIWRDIKGYEGIYQISNWGRVKSLARKKWNGYAFFHINERILKPRYDEKNYVSYVLYKNNTSHAYRVHRLVLSTFVKNVDNKMQINHKNGKKDDNRLCNLEYCTQSENIRHAFENGLFKKKRRQYRYNRQDARRCLDKYRVQAIQKAAEKNSTPILQYSLDNKFIKKWRSIAEAERYYQRRIHIDNKTAIGFVWRKEDR